MLKKRIAILLGCVLLALSCSEDATSSNEEEKLTDIDGNGYQIIQIGNQTWMAENLKVTTYRNGDPIPNVTVDSIWVNLDHGGYCDHQNNPDHANIYGRLYNWYTVNDHRGLAPEGWHIPDNAD